MKDTLEYLVILIITAVLAAVAVRGTLIEPTSRLLNHVVAQIVSTN